MAKEQPALSAAFLATMKLGEDTYERTQELWAEIDYQIEENRLALQKIKLLRRRLDDIARRI
jgi:hypothetical protein